MSESNEIPTQNAKKVGDLRLVWTFFPQSYLHGSFPGPDDSERRFLPQIQRISFLHCAFMLDSADVETLARQNAPDPPVSKIRSFHLEFCPPDRDQTQLAD